MYKIKYFIIIIIYHTMCLRQIWRNIDQEIYLSPAAATLPHDGQLEFQMHKQVLLWDKISRTL